MNEKLHEIGKQKIGSHRIGSSECSIEEGPIGEGRGVEGRYGGLPDPYGNEKTAKIVILPIPFDKTTTYRQGTDLGPDALIEASRNMELYDVETDFEVYKKGIYTAPPVLGKTSESMLDEAYRRTKNYLQSDKFVVTIGGEHSVSYAPIKAFFEHFKTLTILQFDAHADLQPAYENNPWSHASVMARVQELQSPPVKIVSIGIRSLSREELVNLDRKTTFFAHDIATHKMANSKTWEKEVLDLITGPCYITFDLDAFDSSLMPSTGTPEPGGLFWDETMRLLKLVMQKKQVVGFDVVELCPNPNNHAPDYLAAKLIYKLLSYKFSQDHENSPILKKTL